MKSLALRAVFLLALSISWAIAADPQRFVYPPPESANDQRHLYYWQLLEAALEANRDKYGDFVLRADDTPITFQRAVAELVGGGKKVNIVARATSRDLETRLLPVRLPLDKGLLGYRLFLVMPGAQAKLDQVRTLEELKRFTIGLATAWSDVSILRASGFKLELTERYESLFAMLAARRFELFSRGVNEILAEWRSHEKQFPGMQIEKNFVLAYPMPRYFFVPRTEEGERMAERIEDGLRRLAKNGEFDRRYNDYKRLVLDGITLSGRTVFRLPNIELSDKAPPLSDKQWWDDLAKELGPPAPQSKKK